MFSTKSGNPVLSEKRFDSINNTYTTTDAMTVSGTMNKLGFMLLLMMASAFFTWQAFYKGQNVTSYIWIGAIGGLILALVISFKPHLSPYLAPAYALLEGLFLGAISATLNYAFAESMPNIIVNAVGLTMGVAVAMFALYHFKVIKVTQKFRSIIFMATAGIAIFYLINLVLGLFGIDLAFMNFGNGSMLGIGISLAVVAIAALNLLLDFDMIERGAAHGAPKFMEWFGAFGLMVTLVWLYLEILRLLSRFASRD